jgi:hypothetical protein
MNFSTKPRGRNVALTVALGAALALAGGCASMDDGSIELEPTVYVAVAPLDLPEDYDAFPTLYVPVAPLDLQDDGVRAAGDEADEVVLASSDSLMVP